MRRTASVVLIVLLVMWCGAAAFAAAEERPSDTPARDLMASALRDISRCRVLDRAGVQAAWDKMARALAILVSRPGRWAEPENQLRGDVEWLLRSGAEKARTFGRIDSITAVIVRSRGDSSAMFIQPIILGTLRTECLQGNSTQVLLWQDGKEIRHQAFVYGLDRPDDWSMPFRRNVTQLTVWRWQGARVLGVGSDVERGITRTPEFLILREERGPKGTMRWVVRQRISTEGEGYPAWAADVDGDKVDEVILRTAQPEAKPFSECRSCPHIYYDTILKRDGDVFRQVRRERVATPYAALCDFTLALRSGDAAGAARLAASADAVTQAQAAGLDTAAELSALTAVGWRVEIGVDGKVFVVKMVRRNADWLVSSITPKATPAPEAGAAPA